MEIHPQTAGRQTSRYPAFYPDHQALRRDADAEGNLPCSNAPYQIWSQPGFDPEVPYLEFQNLCALSRMLAATSPAEDANLWQQSPTFNPTDPNLARVAARLEHALQRENHPDTVAGLESALTALGQLQDFNRPPRDSAERETAAKQYRQAVQLWPQPDAAKSPSCRRSCGPCRTAPRSPERLPTQRNRPLCRTRNPVPRPSPGISASCAASPGRAEGRGISPR